MCEVQLGVWESQMMEEEVLSCCGRPEEAHMARVEGYSEVVCVMECAVG